MMILKSLYTEPQIIDPIYFNDGVNIILGDKSEESNKTNSVGKSICIEFINFALLKTKKDSRVSLIPANKFPRDAYICLDLIINDDQITIKRTIQDSEHPIILENGKSITFSKLEDATEYLGEKLFSNNFNSHPSFRSMLGPLIRDERSEFKSIIGCYDSTKKNIPDNYSPFLYLFGIEINLYDSIKIIFKDLKTVRFQISRIINDVLLLRGKSINDARADLNELKNEVYSITSDIEKLQSLNSQEIIMNDINKFQRLMDQLNIEKAVIFEKMSKLKPIQNFKNININEVSEFYENLKHGIGKFIQKELDDVLNFKRKIDDFQNRILNEKKQVYLTQLNKIDSELNVVDKQLSSCLKILDKKGNFKNLTQAITTFQRKSDDLSELRALINGYDKLKLEEKRKKADKSTEALELESLIQQQSNVIAKFQETILSLHQYIQGNKLASFKISTTNTVQIVEMDMRIDSDGGHSVERLKVFIFDISLLLNEYTRKNHPGFLIHDNIFDVDSDTLGKCLSFLTKNISLLSQQYICTLNSDEFENLDLKEDLAPFIRAKFTKNNRFLKTEYQED